MRRIPFTAAQSMLEELAGRVGGGLVVCFKTSEYGPGAKKAARRFQSAFAMMRTRYRIDDFQESYFVIRDLGALLEFAQIDFAPLYERVTGQAELQPGDVLPGDTVFQRGTGACHRARRQGA